MCSVVVFAQDLQVEKGTVMQELRASALVRIDQFKGHIDFLGVRRVSSTTSRLPSGCLKYIDVTRTTHTNLDVKQEKSIDDHRNIDGSRDLSDPWTSFTQFTLLEEEPPDGYMWAGVRLTRKQLTSRPDHLWPELWEKMGKNAKLKEKQKWSHEKLDIQRKKIARDLFHRPWGQIT